MAKRPAGEPASAAAEYLVVARRYRPQQFADLVGQEAIAQTLINAIDSNRVAHAYLFTGTRGVGKTSCARILAKALNCEKGPTATPCDRCSSCLGIAEGQDVDVLEIDGASNNKVEEIRELRATVQFRPTRARYRIYIIDEVHMLSTSAFNALLKTLEEPPKHVKFIFATTETQKVPDTILSRCQRFDFLGIARERIADRLKQVTAAEKRPADDEALRLIARHAAGSMRDAQSLLDQALAFAPERVTAESVQQMLGVAADEQVGELVGHILDRDVRSALKLIAAGHEQGLQPAELLDQLIGYWRDLMLIKTAGPDAVDSGSVAGDVKTLADRAEALSLDTILCGLDVLQSTRIRMRNNPHARVLVEMAIVRLGNLADLISVTTLAQSLAGIEPDSPAAARPAPAQYQPISSDAKKKLTGAAGSAAEAVLLLDSSSVSTVWPQILAQIGQIFAHELAFAGQPAILGPKSMVLRFPVAYNRQREACATGPRLERLLGALLRTTGVEWTVRIETVAGEPQVETAKSTAPATQSRLPILETVESVFRGKLMHVDDGFGMEPDISGGDALVDEDR